MKQIKVLDRYYTGVVKYVEKGVEDYELNT